MSVKATIFYKDGGNNNMALFRSINQRKPAYSKKGIVFNIKKVDVKKQKQTLIENGIKALPAMHFKGNIIIGVENIIRTLESHTSKRQDVMSKGPSYSDMLREEMIKAVREGGTSDESDEPLGDFSRKMNDVTRMRDEKMRNFVKNKQGMPGTYNKQQSGKKPKMTKSSDDFTGDEIIESWDERLGNIDDIGEDVFTEDSVSTQYLMKNVDF